MAFALAVPAAWARQGWTVKIRDDEPGITPHVAFLRGPRAWRMCLRTGDFLPGDPAPGAVPAELAEFAWIKRHVLRHSWNAMYPENPVFSHDGEA